MRGLADAGKLRFEQTPVSSGVHIQNVADGILATHSKWFVTTTGPVAIANRVPPPRGTELSTTAGGLWHRRI